MYETELAALCKSLRLSTNLAGNAQSINGGSHQEFLVNLLGAELEYRKDRRGDKLVKDAGFYAVKTIKSFIADDVQFPAEAGLDELKGLEFIANKQNIVMYGGNGTGKTHLSIALGVEACRAGIPVGFYRTANLVNKLSEAKAAGALSKLTAKLDKQEVIVLDEWGYVPLDITGARLLYDIISECYEKKPIILNTNVEFSAWGNVVYDSHLAAAILTRLLHHCHFLVFSGEDMRLKQSSINRTKYSNTSMHQAAKSN